MEQEFFYYFLKRHRLLRWSHASVDQVSARLASLSLKEHICQFWTYQVAPAKARGEQTSRTFLALMKDFCGEFKAFSSPSSANVHLAWLTPLLRRSVKIVSLDVHFSSLQKGRTLSLRSIQALKNLRPRLRWRWQGLYSQRYLFNTNLILMYLFFESLSTAPRKPQIGKLAAKHN